MKTLRNISLMLIASAVMLVSGCGGGGDSAPPPPTVAAIKLVSHGTAGTKIRGIQVTVILPQGVTVKATPSTDDPAILLTNTGVVVPSGVNSTSNFNLANVVGVYTPATATAPGKVAVFLPGAADFDLGEYATVNADLATGTVPLATDFTLIGFSAVDLNGTVISGAAPLVTSTVLPELR